MINLPYSILQISFTLLVYLGLPVYLNHKSLHIKWKKEAFSVKVSFLKKENKKIWRKIELSVNMFLPTLHYIETVL